jgi:hypothetical protein
METHPKKYRHINNDKNTKAVIDALNDAGISSQIIWFTECGDWGYEPDDFSNHYVFYSFVVSRNLPASKIQELVDAALWG